MFKIGEILLCETEAQTTNGHIKYSKRVVVIFIFHTAVDSVIKVIVSLNGLNQGNQTSDAEIKYANQ